MDPTSDIHLYKVKRWRLALNVITLLVMGIVWGAPLAALTILALSIARAESKVDNLGVLFGCLVAPVVLIMAFSLIQMTANVILSFFSYVKVSPDGIEQNFSGFKHIRTKWPEVDRLDKLLLFTDAIYLNSYEVMGPSLSLKAPFRFLRPKQGFISLTGFEGWPGGHLEDDLRRHSPQLFENQQATFVTESEDADVPHKSVNNIALRQEDRLLAALSHASILFSLGGIIVPLIIYATQKQRSAYVGFQSLQAAVWQSIAFVYSLVISTCMIAAGLLPFLAELLHSQRLLEISGGVMVLWVFASLGLMSLGGLIFTIYGLVGAVMSYQGMNFRYVVIAGLLKAYSW